MSESASMRFLLGDNKTTETQKIKAWRIEDYFQSLEDLENHAANFKKLKNG